MIQHPSKLSNLLWARKCLYMGSIHGAWFELASSRMQDVGCLKELQSISLHDCQLLLVEPCTMCQQALTRRLLLPQVLLWRGCKLAMLTMTSPS